MALSDQLKLALGIADQRRNQWKSRDELESIQDGRLQSLLRHARENVPHYKKSLDGVNGRLSLESLPHLPILKKADVAGHEKSFISRLSDEASLYKFHTSGTTGEELMLYLDHEDSLRGNAMRLNAFMQCGFSPRDLLAGMTFSRLPKFPLQPFFYRVKDVKPWDFPDDGFSALKALSPDAVFAYPSTLSILAERNLESGRPLAIKKAITVSEMLRNQAKKRIMESFGCSTRNYYGASECWAIAWECGEGCLHVNSDNVIVEAVDEHGQPVGEGRRGRFLITPLWRRSMPLIRYDIGDTGVLGHGCRCGRGLPIIKSLEGRTADFIIMPSGRRIPWIFGVIGMEKCHGLSAYQVIQEKDGSLDVLIIPETGAGAGVGGSILSSLASALPEKLEIRVQVVREIPPGPRGKRRDFISKMVQRD